MIRTPYIRGTYFKTEDEDPEPPTNYTPYHFFRIITQLGSKAYPYFTATEDGDFDEFWWPIPITEALDMSLEQIAHQYSPWMRYYMTVGELEDPKALSGIFDDNYSELLTTNLPIPPYEFNSEYYFLSSDDMISSRPLLEYPEDTLIKTKISDQDAWNVISISILREYDPIDDFTDLYIADVLDLQQQMVDNIGSYPQSEDVIDAWELTDLGFGIFRQNWVDTFLPDPRIVKLMEPDIDVPIEVGDNLVLHYNIALRADDEKVLDDMRFDTSKIWVRVNGILDFETMRELIQNSRDDSEGKITTKLISMPRELRDDIQADYANASRELWGTRAVVYFTADDLHPLQVSFRIPTNIDAITAMIETEDFIFSREITRPKTKDV